MLLWGPWALDDLERPEQMIAEHHMLFQNETVPLTDAGAQNLNQARRSLKRRMERGAELVPADPVAAAQQFMADLMRAAQNDRPKNVVRH